jgi:hypothetical protein
MRHSILLIAALLTTSALAIDPPRPQTAPPAAEREDIADADKEAAARTSPDQTEEEDEVLPPLPDNMTPAGPPPARFNPTEKVRADFPVSFPIDI